MDSTDSEKSEENHDRGANSEENEGEDSEENEGENSEKDENADSADEGPDRDCSIAVRFDRWFFVLSLLKISISFMSSIRGFVEQPAKIAKINSHLKLYSARMSLTTTIFIKNHTYSQSVISNGEAISAETRKALAGRRTKDEQIGRAKTRRLKRKRNSHTRVSMLTNEQREVRTLISWRRGAHRARMARAEKDEEYRVKMEKTKRKGEEGRFREIRSHISQRHRGALGKKPSNKGFAKRPGMQNANRLDALKLQWK